MDRSQLKQELNISKYETAEEVHPDESFEKDEVIDVLHVYPIKNDDKKNYLKNISPKNIIAELSTYKQTKIWTFFRSSVINIFLPFLNGVFLGFGEIFAHEVSSRWGFLGFRRLRGFNIL
ncbi:hypothetical protein PCK1_001943 [Pneumocystis canis]|nr:hypothetical protein PCK1_001943 [Pneumocystis canis]